MKLTIHERLILLGVLPGEGDFTTLRIIRELRESLSFSEEEHKVLKFQFQDNQVTWESKAEKDKEVHIGERATDIIRGAFKQLNDQKRLRLEHMDLYERFIGNG